MTRLIKVFWRRHGSSLPTECWKRSSSDYTPLTIGNSFAQRNKLFGGKENKGRVGTGLPHRPENRDQLSDLSTYFLDRVSSGHPKLPILILPARKVWLSLGGQAAFCCTAFTSHVSRTFFAAISGLTPYLAPRLNWCSGCADETPGRRKG